MHPVMHDQAGRGALARRGSGGGGGAAQPVEPVAQAAGDVTGGGAFARGGGLCGHGGGHVQRRAQAGGGGAGGGGVVGGGGKVRDLAQQFRRGLAQGGGNPGQCGGIGQDRGVGRIGGKRVAEKVALGAVQVVARDAGVAVGEGGDEAGAVRPAQKMRPLWVGRAGGKGRVEAVGARMVGDQQVDQTFEFRGGNGQARIGIGGRVMGKSGRQVSQPEDAEQHVADQVARVEL